MCRPSVVPVTAYLVPTLAGLLTGAGLIIAIGAQNAFVLAQSLRREHHLPVAALCVLCDALLVDTISRSDTYPYVDVREDDEWALGRAAGAQHLPLGQLPDRLEELDPDTDYYVICRTGGRSARAATGHLAPQAAGMSTGPAIAGLVASGISSCW